MRLPLDRPQLSVPYLATSYLSLLTLFPNRTGPHTQGLEIHCGVDRCVHVRRPSSHSRRPQRGWRRGHTTKGNLKTRQNHPAGSGLKLLVPRGHMRAAQQQCDPILIRCRSHGSGQRTTHHTRHQRCSDYAISTISAPPGDTVIRHDSRNH